MSTHNIGFYEDSTKIIVELSSNIIKYAPYFFCCIKRAHTRQGNSNRYPQIIISSSTEGNCAKEYPLIIWFIEKTLWGRRCSIKIKDKH